METSNRNYPTSPYSSNLVGFAAFDEDGQEIQGKLGLELTMNDYLSGTNGRVKYQQTVDGTVLPGTTQVYEEAVEGNNVYLTIDSNLQSIVETQLQRTMEDNSAQSAWALVMEPETGKFLPGVPIPPTIRTPIRRFPPSWTTLRTRTWKWARS